MNLEIFTICDAATVSGGKLNILGAFDTITSGEIPVVHRALAIVIRLRGKTGDIDNHKISLIAVDEQGDNKFPNIVTDFFFRKSEDVSNAVNFIMNIQDLKFEKLGTYYIKLKVDDNILGEIPLFIKQKN